MEQAFITNYFVINKSRICQFTTFPTNPLFGGYIMLRRRGYKSPEGAKIKEKLQNNGVIPYFTCLTFNPPPFFF